MESRRVLIVLLRRWWLVVGLPLVVMVGTLLTSGGQPYVATVRATILIPGDTETRCAAPSVVLRLGQYSM